jgi:hypothetical protein
MKFTTAQLKKANSRVVDKYGQRVLFNNDIQTHTRVVYMEIIQTTNDQYVKNYLESLLNTECTFNDIYYSI